MRRGSANPSGRAEGMHALMCGSPFRSHNQKCLRNGRATRAATPGRSAVVVRCATRRARMRSPHRSSVAHHRAARRVAGAGHTRRHIAHDGGVVRVDVATARVEDLSRLILHLFDKIDSTLEGKPKPCYFQHCSRSELLAAWLRDDPEIRRPASRLKVDGADKIHLLYCF